jgi:hypothetical protein
VQNLGLQVEGTIGSFLLRLVCAFFIEVTLQDDVATPISLIGVRHAATDAKF